MPDPLHILLMLALLALLIVIGREAALELAAHMRSRRHDSHPRTHGDQNGNPDQDEEV